MKPERVALPAIVGPLEPIPFTDEKEFYRARWEWHDAVLRDSAIKYPYARLVGLYLCKLVSFPDAICWPTAETIADELDISVPHVKRSLALLRERGWIHSIGRAGFGKPTRYILTTDASVLSSIEWALAPRKEDRAHRRAIGITRDPNGETIGLLATRLVRSLSRPG